MTTWETFVAVQIERGAIAAEYSEAPLVASYGDPAAEYRAVSSGPAIVDRSYRALIEVRGTERTNWLHNLTTNQVKTLGRGEGNHAFVLNTQGRILFEVNVLVLEESIWVDLDRRFLAVALKHFDKYIITEDVTITDRSDDFVRLGLVGEAARMLASEFGVSNAVSMPALSTAAGRWKETPMLVMRHDFCGPFGVELFVPSECPVELWEELTAPSRPDPAITAGDDAVQAHRIEMGLPWPGREITDEHTPAETGRIERAVSFDKGCYLGQEIVERMRSRDVVARELCGLRILHDVVPPRGARLVDHEGKAIGQVTSSCYSPAQGGVIALGYLRRGSTAPGTGLKVAWDGGSTPAEVTGLPFGDTPVN